MALHRQTFGTQIFLPRCDGEGRIGQTGETVPSSVYDIRAARELVQQGVITPEEGLERADHIGFFSKSATKQMLECLGRIAQGECPHYPREN